MRSINDFSALSLQQALAQAQALGLARLDVQWLLLHALGRPLADRAWLLSHAADTRMEQGVHARFADFCQRLQQGEPLGYILGQQEFFGLTLAVDPRVLLPRPDTEILVEWGLAVLQGMPVREILEVLDLGTGSGAVALGLAHGLQHQKRVQILAVDSSLEALRVAASNAGAWPIELLHSHWFDHVPKPPEGFDLIVSNPPYIAEADPHLASLAHEPLMALVSGVDGLDAVREIVAQALPFLRPGGWLLLEHGYDQAASVRGLLAAAGFSAIQSRRDLAGIERCSGGSR